MGIHLVILVHGLWGNASHFNYIKAQLEESYDKTLDENLAVYQTGSNEGYKTYDGIDLCGKRVAQEIELEIARLNVVDKVVKISVVGYSLGGLIARYAIGILYYHGVFKDIVPVNFTTFCSPHVGVLTPGDGISIKIFNWLVPFLLANSGKQMFLKDKAKVSLTNGGTPSMSRSNSFSNLIQNSQVEHQPLLMLMANPASIFFKSLKAFKYKLLYANVVNDKRTSWWTAGISMINPFEILDVNPNIRIDHNGVLNLHNGNRFKVSFVSNYNPIIIDAHKPIQIITKGLGYVEHQVNPLTKNIPGLDDTLEKEKLTAATDYAENFFKRKFKWLIVIFNIVIYAPMWVAWFILANLIERFKSGLRVVKESDAASFLEFYQLSEEDDLNDESTKKRPSLSRTLSETYDNLETKFEQNLQDQTDELMESVWDAMMSKKINDDDESFWFDNKEDPLADKPDQQLSISFSDLSLNKIEPFKENDDFDHILQNFNLKFNNQSQYEIIKNLNSINWTKFPIYIQETKATHPAAIVRHLDKHFGEGEIVVKHFCQEIFKYD